MAMCGEVLVNSFIHWKMMWSDTKLGHCFLMMDDLQQAYSAYQQALYHLRDPKVSLIEGVYPPSISNNALRSPNCGMALVYSMIDMARSNTPKKRFLKSCACSQILKRPTRSIFVWA